MRILLVILTGILLLTGCAGKGDSAMANDGDIYSIGNAMHIHPALSEVVVAALGNLK